MIPQKVFRAKTGNYQGTRLRKFCPVGFWHSAGCRAGFFFHYQIWQITLPFWKECLRSKSSKFSPNGSRTALNRTLSIFPHHPVRLILVGCGRRVPVLLSSRLRSGPGCASTMAVVHVFRGRFVVLPSKTVTNACRAVCSRSSDFLPGLGAQQSGRALFCSQAI